MAETVIEGVEGMKRQVIGYVIFVITAIVLLASSAKADHWKAISSLLPGTYMLTYMCPESTATVHEMYDYFGERGVEPATNIIYTGYMAVFGFNEKYNSKNLAEFMNAEPNTPPEFKPELFKLEPNPDGDSWWRQIPLPLKWLKGDAVM